MRILWYIAQALFIGWIMYAYWASDPMMDAGKLGVMLLIAVVICAFLTACITQSWDWAVRRLRGLRRDDSQTSRDSLSLAGPRRSLPKTPKQVDGVRVRK